MPTLRERVPQPIWERIKDIVYPQKRFNADFQRLAERDDKIDELTESVRLLFNAQQSRWDTVAEPAEMIVKMKEQGYDSGYLFDLITQLQWEEIGASGSSLRGGERERVAEDSRRQWIYNPLYQWAVWLWTNYGFGQQVSVVPVDEGAIDTWAEFWQADRNDPVLAADNVQQLSIDTLVDGNLFLAYHASDQDGETTVTEVIPDEITEVLMHPRNDQMPVFYKRLFKDADGEKTWYYPDWTARATGIIDQPFDNTGKTIAEKLEIPPEQRTDLMATDADTVGKREFAGTVTVMQWIRWNRKEKRDGWGWPLSTTAGPWLRSHRQFVSHRLTVSAAKAMFVRRKKVKGGSRAVASTINSIASNLSRSKYLDSNPAAAAGSVEVENQAVTTDDLNMRTGAEDAKTDNEIFTWMPSLALGVYPHYMGLGDSYRLATATSMEKPLEMQWDRYQSFWQAQFRRMFRIVIEFANEFGNIEYDTASVVTMDRVTEVDLDGASAGITSMFDSIFTPALEGGTLDANVYRELVNFMVNYTLEALGGNDLAQAIQVDKAKDADRPEPQDDDTDAEPAEARVLIQVMQNFLEHKISYGEAATFLRETIKGE